VAAHQGNVAVVDEDDLVLRDGADLLVPQREDDRGRVVADDGLTDLPRVAELAHDFLGLADVDHLGQHVHLLRVRRQVSHFR
jgi:hypothetical protein